jgi:hypothetical protein
MIDLEFLVGPAVVVLPEEIDVINAGSLGEQLIAAIVPGAAQFTTAGIWQGRL